MSLANTEKSFKCTIKQPFEISQTGEISDDTGDWKLGAVGEVFSVDRTSGVITVGGTVRNTTGTKPVVTKDGGNVSEFVVLSRHPSGDLSVLRIHLKEYKDVMPFFYMNSAGYASGVCIFN